MNYATECKEKKSEKTNIEMAVSVACAALMWNSRDELVDEISGRDVGEFIREVKKALDDMAD